jgi:hypothetical protein
VIKEVGLGPQVDQELLRKVVDDRIIKKDEFVIAMNYATQDPKKPRDPPGPLKNLRINGEKAIGTTYDIIRGESAEAGQPSKPFAQKVEYNIVFRKTAEGWLYAGPEPTPPLLPGQAPPPPLGVPKGP